MTSMRFKDMDMALDDDDGGPPPRPDADEDGGDDDDDDDDDDDLFSAPPPDALAGPLNAIPSGSSHEDNKNQTGTSTGTTDSMASSGKPFLGFTAANMVDLFVPDSNYKVNLDEDSKRPDMPDLPESALPKGTTVWVVDDSYVKMQLGDGWERYLAEFCAGRKKGDVVRHQERLTLVHFKDDKNDCSVTVTLPRRCLSKEAIEPLPLEQEGQDDGLSINVGGLGPRAGRAKEKRKEEVVVLQQLAELVLNDKLELAANLETGATLFNKKKFAEAASQFSEDIAALGKKDTDKSVKLYTWRSLAYFFDNKIPESLTDALKTTELDSKWTLGYVRASRSYLALGKHQDALDKLKVAHKLLPEDSALNNTVELAHLITRLQQQLNKYHLIYTLAPSYARRLLAHRSVKKGDTIYSDDTFAGAPSIENVSSCCDVCMYPDAVSQSLPFLPNKKALLCNGQRCIARTKHFLPLEMGRATRSFEFAMTMMQNKGQSSADLLSLERARLAVRVFYLVFSKQSAAPAATPELMLRSVGLYPIPSSNLDNKTSDDLESLHNVITNFMTPDERATFNLKLLTKIFNYVVDYGLQIDGKDAKGKQITGYVLTPVVSCVSATATGDQKPNCKVEAVGNGKIGLIAVTDIKGGEPLVIPQPRKGRILE